MTSDIMIAADKVIANSRNSRPSIPPISRMGTKTATSERLIDSTVKATSRAPCNAACIRDIPASMCRVTFSSTTIASSTTKPVEIVSAISERYLSLMALTISTGFVVDDAIVVLENVTRHIEAGMSRMQAALQGAREVAFTVLSMSLSLVAVFVPILLMGGIEGRLFREFAMTLSAAIMISLVMSLTTTPLRKQIGAHHRRDDQH